MLESRLRRGPELCRSCAAARWKNRLPSDFNQVLMAKLYDDSSRGVQSPTSESLGFGGNITGGEDTRHARFMQSKARTLTVIFFLYSQVS